MRTVRWDEGWTMVGEVERLTGFTDNTKKVIQVDRRSPPVWSGSVWFFVWSALNVKSIRDRISNGPFS